jgi:tripartite-type tricarboxylate transporter receptor subunit TctC
VGLHFFLTFGAIAEKQGLICGREDDLKPSTKHLAQPIRIALAVFAIGFTAPDRADAQSYPNRPIKFIANGASGGVIDTMARVTANALGPLLGVQVIVENKPGASSVIGTQFVVNSAPDGYTLLFTGVDGMGILPSPMKQMPYDPEKDLIPIAKVTQVDVVLAVGSHVKANSVREFVELAKANPGKLTFASTGLGTGRNRFARSTC